ncbi:hypothetical protein ACFSQ7_04130 [Paenibacillus rhizoplanae]
MPGKGLVYRGMLKAAVVKLLVPLFMLEAAVFIALMGPWIIADMIVVLLALLLYAVICFLTFPKALPFSEKYEATQRKEFTGSAFCTVVHSGGAGRSALCLHPDSCGNIHLYGNSGSCKWLDLAQGLPAGPAAGRQFFQPSAQAAEAKYGQFFCRCSKKGSKFQYLLRQPGKYKVKYS